MDVIDAEQFLVNCTASLILDHGVSKQEDQNADIQEILMVRLVNYMLKNVDTFECCVSLRICILADNFITHIAPLSECIHLVKLDLSGNQVCMRYRLCYDCLWFISRTCLTCPCQFQITQLPDKGFWKKFEELQLLNLHDNNLSTQQHVMGLSGCPNLVALTLYNTPLSLKENYRHCMVNSLWSLKALDKHVISDVEIMEGFILPPKFKQMAPHLAVDLHPVSKEVSSHLCSHSSLQCSQYHMHSVIVVFINVHLTMCKLRNPSRVN